jgi:CPA1 family monovalent cation:H+ antiporter
MSFFQIASILLTLTALFSYVNHRFIRLPTTIGVTLISLGFSMALIFLGHFTQSLRGDAAKLVAQIDFEQLILHGVLSLLLFAGALQLDLAQLRKEFAPITVLSLVGTVISTFLIQGFTWCLFRAMGIPLPAMACLLFGALISPTDPIAVLAIIKNARGSKSLQTQIAGESLFNDGVGVVIFLTVLAIATGTAAPTVSGVTLLLVRQVIGGIAVGVVAGGVTNALLAKVDDWQVEILLTIALAMGGFTLAERLHVSAPLAAVAAGLVIGNTGRRASISQATLGHLDAFWELVDEVLNAMVFLLVGLVLLVTPVSMRFMMAGMAAVGIVLAARWVSVAVSIGSLRPWRKVEAGTITVLTWGGLRGALSLSMALSLPNFADRPRIVAMTYGVVVFSIFVQGLSIGPIMRGLVKREAAGAGR